MKHPGQPATGRPAGNMLMISLRPQPTTPDSLRLSRWYGGEAVVVWYYSKDHFRIERKCASPFAADTTGCAWRLRVDCRARIFEFVSQSLTAALNVHPSSTSSTSSPAWSCWRCQTVIQLQKALSGSDHKSPKMSKDRLIKAAMATTKIFCV